MKKVCEMKEGLRKEEIPTKKKVRTAVEAATTKGNKKTQGSPEEDLPFPKEKLEGKGRSCRDRRGDRKKRALEGKRK